MKLDPNFLTHVTDGEHYMISTTDTKFNGIVKNNYTAAFIVECLKSDTYARGKGSTVAAVSAASKVSAIAGGANIGRNPDWCGNIFNLEGQISFTKILQKS